MTCSSCNAAGHAGPRCHSRARYITGAEATEATERRQWAFATHRRAAIRRSTSLQASAVAHMYAQRLEPAFHQYIHTACHALLDTACTRPHMASEPASG